VRPASRTSLRPLAQAVPNPLDHERESLIAERLQQIVERMLLERLERVLVVGGDEDDQRRRVAVEMSDDVEPVHFRHLHVEKQHIGLLRVDDVDGLRAGRARGRDNEIGFARDEQFERLPRKRLVVDNDRAPGAGRCVGHACT
jgi:hypothetical protein